MNEKLDYEKKVCGVREGSYLWAFKPWGLQSLPREFKDVGGKVLDVGCGAGAFTGLLKRERPDLEIYGVDISKKAIKLAKKDFPDINFSVADARRLSFPSNFFDAAVMRQVLEHLEDPSKALIELRRVLKPGALFYSATPLEGDNLVLKPPRRLVEKYQGHVQRFSRAQLLSLLEKSGFKIERFYFWGFLFAEVSNVLCLLLFEFLGLPREFSVEHHVSRGDSTIGRSLLSVLRKLVFLLKYIESRIVPKGIPGHLMCIVARKV